MLSGCRIVAKKLSHAQLYSSLENAVFLSDGERYGEDHDRDSLEPGELVAQVSLLKEIKSTKSKTVYYHWQLLSSFLTT